jgi:hypothetical protein
LSVGIVIIVGAMGRRLGLSYIYTSMLVKEGGHKSIHGRGKLRGTHRWGTISLTSSQELVSEFSGKMLEVVLPRRESRAIGETNLRAAAIRKSSRTNTKATGDDFTLIQPSKVKSFRHTTEINGTSPAYLGGNLAISEEILQPVTNHGCDLVT